MPAITTFRYDKSIKTPYAGRTISVVVTVTVNNILVPRDWDSTELRSQTNSQERWIVAFLKESGKTISTAPATIVSVD